VLCFHLPSVFCFLFIRARSHLRSSLPLSLLFFLQSFSVL
jgi:hypothetical protein